MSSPWPDPFGPVGSAPLVDPAADNGDDGTAVEGLLHFTQPPSLVDTFLQGAPVDDDDAHLPGVAATPPPPPPPPPPELVPAWAAVGPTDWSASAIAAAAAAAVAATAAAPPASPAPPAVAVAPPFAAAATRTVRRKAPRAAALASTFAMPPAAAVSARKMMLGVAEGAVKKRRGRPDGSLQHAEAVAEAARLAFKAKTVAEAASVAVGVGADSATAGGAAAAAAKAGGTSSGASSRGGEDLGEVSNAAKYTRRLQMNRNSAAASRIHRRAYMAALEASLREADATIAALQATVEEVRVENAALKAQVSVSLAVSGVSLRRAAAKEAEEGEAVGELDGGELDDLKMRTPFST
ncbi:hypothetical protein BU14_0513s0012 [Porphyra umbilicalis]|uniref:BZIP domain-containing protein n=1 Tax=Porphyra umbilicalis TaxID=2786 RepID=A0A1X6NSV0_PORUM|nr:hypothetical protein BU14_0513s0012 [Porphyra umbilicalis]|eukprot:OSX71668.1 hypothetical protein BU14_0513s0012 [Porphyra umbilicalis]